MVFFVCVCVEGGAMKRKGQERGRVGGAGVSGRV